jgi:hypothetical protein
MYVVIETRGADMLGLADQFRRRTPLLTVRGARVCSGRLLGAVAAGDCAGDRGLSVAVASGVPAGDRGLLVAVAAGVSAGDRDLLGAVAASVRDGEGTAEQ